VLEAADVRNRVDVGEVHDVSDVRGCQTRRLRVSIDRNDSEPQIAHALDRAALVPARAYEEDGSLH